MALLAIAMLFSPKFWHLVRKKPVDITPSAFTCSKVTIETLGQGVKYVQS